MRIAIIAKTFKLLVTHLVMLVDIHCHLDSKEFNADLDKVIKKCKRAGVDAASRLGNPRTSPVRVIISNGTSQKSNEKVLKIAAKYDIVHAALGLFPTEALKLTDMQVDKALNFIAKQKSKIVAIGEVGIDFYWVKDAKEQAKECEIFERVVKLANTVKLPLIVHTRGAEDKVLELLKAAKVPVDLHFFCGNAELTEIGVRRGYYFSIPTSITRSKTMRKLARRVPLKQLLTETDSPELCPVRGERNDPSYIRQVVDKIAEVKGLSVAKVERQVRVNCKRVFGV